MADLTNPHGIMTELGAIWYEVVTNGDGHKDRDCHFTIECSFSYGKGPKFSAAHFGYVDEGFGHACARNGSAKFAEFETHDAALWFCIDETLKMLRRHHSEMTPWQIDRAKAASEAWRGLRK